MGTQAKTLPVAEAGTAQVPTRLYAITHETAEQLRQMLSDIQYQIMLGHGLMLGDTDATRTVDDLVEFVSNVGFRLVDDLEGVIR